MKKFNITNKDVHWDGGNFIFNGMYERILQISNSTSGWSEELAELMHMENDYNRPIGIASRRHTLNEIRKYLNNNKSPYIMEIGCSTGYLIDDISNFLPEAKIVGTDIIYESLKKLSDSFPLLPLIQMDLSQENIFSNYFDCIIALNVLEHIEDDKMAVSNIYKMLKKNGVFITEVPAGPSLYDVFDRKLKHYRRYNMHNLLEMLENSDFKIINHTHLGFIPFPIFWFKKKWNRRLLNSPESVQEEIIKNDMQISKRSVLLSMTFRLEELIRKMVYLPVGIRCLVTCRKN